MITSEHLRFVALLIPTWLLLGAAGLTLAVVPPKDRAAATVAESAVYAPALECRANGGAAAHHFESEAVIAWE